MQQSTSIEVPGYTIREVLGTGGSATVFLARHHALQRDIALKILNKELVDNPVIRQRFVREALDTASISEHPNIMTIYDSGYHNDVYYIALQYLPGLSLKDQIDAGSSIANPWNIMYQLAGALAHVHSKGFLHRDIKPANVLFTLSGHPVLADFGVAHRASILQKTAGRKCNSGTTKYMSPEQFQGTVHTDARSDLYSLGLVFHEMLTGELPFILKPPLISHLLSSCTLGYHNRQTATRLPTPFAHFQELIDQLIQQKPEHRLQSADELLAALSLLKNSSHHAAGFTAPTSHDEALIKRRKTKQNRYGTVRITTTILALATLTASSSHTEDLIQARTTATECPVSDEVQTEELNKLLRLAKMHYQVGRLSYPPGANAVQAYSKALDIDPCNRFIDETLQQIHKRVVELASNKNISKRYSSPSRFHLKNSNTDSSAYESLDFGRYHALIIGNQVYDNLVNLPHVKNDTAAIERMLAQHFGFDTTLLQNATQKQTLVALEQLRATLGSEDNLLIFYVGHGDIDSQASRGYWLPSDATLSDITSWIPNQTVKSIIDSMLAKHVLIIANNCYSGAASTFNKTDTLPELKVAAHVDWLRANLPLKVRATLCMNKGIGYLSSTDSANKSLFSKVFLDTLAHTHQPVSTYQLLQKMQEHLDEFSRKHQSQASLEYAPMNNSSHQSGEFIFFPKTQK